MPVCTCIGGDLWDMDFTAEPTSLSLIVLPRIKADGTEGGMEFICRPKVLYKLVQKGTSSYTRSSLQLLLIARYAKSNQKLEFACAAAAGSGTAVSRGKGPPLASSVIYLIMVTDEKFGAGYQILPADFCVATVPLFRYSYPALILTSYADCLTVSWTPAKLICLSEGRSPARREVRSLFAT